MPTSTKVTDLKINELTEAQYDTAVQQGIIGENELSVLTDAEAGQVIQVATMPTAAVGELDKIYQFIGTTDANYTNGYFYKCVSDGQTPATYSWTQTDVQPAPSGLPDQTGQSGKFLTTDGTDASWSGKPLVNTATGFNTVAVRSQSLGIAIQNAVAIGVLTNVKTQCVAIGYDAVATDGINAVAIGFQANCARFGVAIGPDAKTTQSSAIQLGTGTNSNANTFKVGNANGNFEIMSADGTIPTDRFTTTPVADGTYVPTLTISSGVATRSWAAPSGGGSTALSLTLAAANWSNNTITVTATGVTASNNVIVSPAPASQSAYTTAGVMCTGQSTNSLTFTATTTPSSDIVVTVLIV